MTHQPALATNVDDSPAPRIFRALPVWAKAAALAALTIIAYLPALNAGYIWDDSDHYTDNTLLRTLDGLGHIWTRPTWSMQYYPVTLTTLWIDYQLWGLNPVGSHAVNIALHAGSVVLLWLILRRLGLPAAWLAAALFALHPVHVETVAWISERKNTLSGFFYLASALLLVRYFRLSELDTATPKTRAYVAAFILFVLAVLSKTATCTLPAAVALLIYWKRGRFTRREIGLLLPMLVVGVAMGMVTAWMEKVNVGAVGTAWDLSLLDRVLVAGRIVWFYAWKLLWPATLSFSYERWDIDTSEPWQYVFPVTALLVIGGLWALHRRVGRGPLVAVLFFGGTLVPALGFIDVYPFRFSFVADHFQYLASIGLLVLGAEAIRLGLNRSQLGGNTRTFTLVALIAGPALLTAQRCLVFKDMESIWLDTVAKTPGSWLAHASLGQVYGQQGDFDRAVEHYQRAIEIAPHEPEPYLGLAVVLDQFGRRDDAMLMYRRSVEIGPKDVRSRHCLARALAARDQKPEAIEEFKRVLAIEPRHEPAAIDLAALLIERGEIDEAIRQYRLSIQANPNLVRARMALGALLLQHRRYDEALAILREARHIDTKNPAARLSLGVALVQTGRVAEGIEELTAATRLAPNLALAHANLAAAYQILGKTTEARSHYSRAIELQPNLKEAQDGLNALESAQ